MFFQTTQTQKREAAVENMSKDQLAERLVELFGNTDLIDIDGAVANAKSKLHQKNKIANLERLFNSQIATLEERGVPEQIIYRFRDQRDEVLNKALKMNFGFGRIPCIPFLPIIPQIYLSIYSQISMVRNNSISGFTILDPNNITDTVTTSKNPYYIYDVDDGETTIGMAPRNAEDYIKRYEHFCLTAVEIIAIGIHTNILSRNRYVNAVGSRCDSIGGVVALFLYQNRNPKLDLIYSDFGNKRFGTAFCGSRG